jgi:hypothetical protein
MQHGQDAQLRVQAKESGMNTLERGSGDDLYRPTWAAIGWSILKAGGYVIRLVIFGPLAVLEPLINWVLSMGCVLGLLCCVVFKLEDTAGVHHFHYGLMLSFSVGCAVLLTLYYILLRALAP